MKVVVIGEDGPVRSRLVTLLHERGHETVAGVRGASVVVDLSKDSSDTTVRNLLAAEAAAGVEHHVSLTDNASVEELVEQSSIPYSIVHVTLLSDETAGALARIAIGPPANGVVTLDHS
jgi:putative NADH-flavin reductase